MLTGGATRMIDPSCTVRVTVQLPLGTRLKLDAICRARPGIYPSRSEVVREAIYLWLLREEQRLVREQRAKFNQLWREAEEWAPIDQLLASAKQPWEEEV
jgi:Arc/MetJ-type ribon-helix-helix transcriptional regulator